MDKTEQEIINYYDACEGDYRLLWNLDESLALHAGFWDHTVKNLSQALVRENEVLAELGSISKNDRVLDAGCGIGGSSIFLAEKIGCHVTGISICQKQIDKAKKIAIKRNQSHLTDFAVMDFCQTSFSNESFDVVWAIESVCHAKDKSIFLKEAYRILRPGGRLIVADGFSSNNSSKSMQKWLSGWAVDSLSSESNFKNSLVGCGFQHIQCKDVTPFVLPSSKKLFYISLPAWPLSKIGEYLKLRSFRQTNNIRAAFYQYIALKNKLWNYLIFISKK